jgi:uncharacterized protein (DUF1015 family)
MSKHAENLIFKAQMMLPNKRLNLTHWAVVACDQFTCQKNYWETLKQSISEHPSTYHLILPEAYLKDINEDTIKNINQTMQSYIDQKIIQPIGEQMIFIERTMMTGKTRLGLLATIDLETYDFNEGAKTAIRATEKTILERIPPRLNIRKQAKLDLTHVMLLINDAKKEVIESLQKKKDSLEVIYDFDLNMDGGHIKGYLVKDTEDLIKRFNQLFKQSNHDLCFIAGDGNHSLATAKTHWDQIKKDLQPTELEKHPARFALVEIVNLYDEGLEFEGIHRFIINPKDDFMDLLEKEVYGEEKTWLYTKSHKMQPLSIPKKTAHAYEQVQSLIDQYLQNNPDVEVDYIHGDDDLIELCEKHKDAIGIRMPALKKDDLFPYIASGHVLPIKSFSMGAAVEKRYYLESRLLDKDH